MSSCSMICTVAPTHIDKVLSSWITEIAAHRCLREEVTKMEEERGFPSFRLAFFPCVCNLENNYSRAREIAGMTRSREKFVFPNARAPRWFCQDDIAKFCLMVRIILFLLHYLFEDCYRFWWVSCHQSKCEKIQLQRISIPYPVDKEDWTQEIE